MGARTRTAAAMVAMALIVAGCSSASGSEPTNTPTGAGTDSTQPVGSTAAGSAAAGSTTAGSTTAGSTTVGSTAPGASSATGETSYPTKGVNALTLRGPSYTTDVPEMTPVVTDPEPKLPATVTDATGKRVTVTSAHRVLALGIYGALTNTMIGLGLADRLVGRARSDTQPSLAHLPVVSEGGIELNVEAVLNLKPDVILTNTTIGTPKSYRQLEDAGVTVVHFEHIPSFKGIGQTITEVGDVFGMSAAATKLAKNTQRRLEDARATIDRLAAATPRKPRAIVLYVRGTGGIFFIFGKGYGASDILHALKLEDVADEHGITDLEPANAEALASLDPEVILTMKDGVKSAGGVNALLGRAGIAATTAGMHRRLIIAGDTQLLAYGPRTPEDLLALGRAIYTAPSGETGKAGNTGETGKAGNTGEHVETGETGETP